MNLLALHFMINWLPIIAGEAGPSSAKLPSFRSECNAVLQLSQLRQLL
jgi:hypothetical protein